MLFCVRNLEDYSIIVEEKWLLSARHRNDNKKVIQRRIFMALGGNSSWDKIQQGVKDTERLIVQREYNASMIKARQTLEFMVKNLADQAGIMDESDLKGMIDMLYENRWISKATCEHYHKIRMIGNKAAHEGDANAYSANQAYHMLSQEVYTFADDYRNVKKGRNRAAARTAPVETGRMAQEHPRGTAQAVITVETARAAATVEIVAAVLRQPGAGNAPAARVPPFRYILC